MPPRRIVLVGFMGTGKSTSGRALAERLGWAFRDLDAWIEARAGRTIAQMWKDEGEASFREREREAALDCQALTEHVIAAGGGAFAQEATRAALKTGAATVCLTAELDTIVARVAGDDVRPLATDRERMRALLAERDKYYREADLVVDTTNTPPGEVADRIVSALFHGPDRQGGTER